MVESGRDRDCQVVVCCVDADAAFGDRLTMYLREQRGYTVFFYKETATGTAWTNGIRRKLDAALAVIVVQSKNSEGSAHLEDEALRARSKGTYFPVQIDPLPTDTLVSGDGVVQSIRLNASSAPTGQQKVKFDADLDELVLRNGPESYQRIVHRLEFALQKETKQRKLAEENAMQIALSKEGEESKHAREASDLQVSRALALCEALVSMLRRFTDAMEQGIARPAIDSAVDEVTNEAVARLKSIWAQTAQGEIDATRQELRLRIAEAVQEIDRLQRLRSARA